MLDCTTIIKPNNEIQIGPIPVWREIGIRGEASSKEKKIPHESQMAHFKLPMNGLAGLMK